MPTVYPSLNIGASRRLAIFKRESAERNSKPYGRTDTTWRDMRYATLKSPTGLDRGFNGDDPIWYCHNERALPGRWVKDCHDRWIRDHRGWYTDLHCDEKAIGIIVALPHGRFLAGYRWTGYDEYVIYGDIYDDESEAAYAADGHAERFAEISREDDERYLAVTEAESHAEDVESDVRDAIAHRNEPRNSRHDPREWLRERIAELRAARRDVDLATEAYNCLGQSRFGSRVLRQTAH